MPIFKRRALARLAVLCSIGAISTTALAGGNSANAFNPKISLVLNGTYADFSSGKPATIPGFLLGGESGFVPEGFSLGETELAVDSNVDNWLHAWASLSFEDDHGETEAHVEEAFLETLTLPYGFSAKFGRFFSAIGYMNSKHAHTWQFADAPLVYQSMLGGQLADDGLQIRWLAPTDYFLEFGAEALRGIGYPAGGPDRSGVRNWTAFMHVGGDIGFSSSWRFGLSHLGSSSTARETEQADGSRNQFSGDSRLNIASFVYKWAPNGNSYRHNFVFNAEYFHRKEEGEVSDPSTSIGSDYDGTQSGFYVLGVYQFMPRWRLGLRYGQLKADNQLSNPQASTLLADDGGTPRRYSAMLDYSNSEFSRIRLQFNRDESRVHGEPDNQVIVQYIAAIGSHPAHSF